MSSSFIEGRLSCHLRAENLVYLLWWSEYNERPTVDVNDFRYCSVTVMNDWIWFHRTLIAYTCTLDKYIKYARAAKLKTSFTTKKKINYDCILMSVIFNNYPWIKRSEIKLLFRFYRIINNPLIFSDVFCIMLNWKIILYIITFLYFRNSFYIWQLYGQYFTCTQNCTQSVGWTYKWSFVHAYARVARHTNK